MEAFVSTLWATLKTFQLKDAVDILLISLIIFYALRLFRETRAGQLVKGVVVLLIAYALSAIFDLTMINYILRSIFEFSVIIFVVVFQPELRQALEKLGRNKTLKNILSSPMSAPTASVTKAISDVADACAVLSSSKTGALIVFERDSNLTDVARTGTELNADTSVALLGNLFFNKAPLHDGACIIRGGKMLAAGCILPLTAQIDISDNLGTRHRAAIGMSEESDAVVVVVSEETGIISVALNGNLLRGFDRSTLNDKLGELILSDADKNQNLFTILFKSRKEKKDET